MQLQMIFEELAEKRAKLKDLNQIVRDAKANSAAFQLIESQIKELRERRKVTLLAIEESLQRELEQIDGLKVDIASHEELLSDAALSLFTKGERVEVVDKYGNAYDPKFKVKFKKA